MIISDSHASGLFDGEGMIRINRWEKPGSTHIRYALYGSLGMTYRPIIEALQLQHGGSLSVNMAHLRNPKNRPQFVWTIASQTAAAFLRRIRPYSIVKADEIDIALALQSNIDDNPYIPGGRHHMNERPGREAMMAYRQNLHDEITALKKRSFAPLLTGGA